VPTPEARFNAGQASVAGLILVWRILTIPAATLWRDWLLVVAAYWLILSIAPRSSSRSTLTVTAMAYLLGIYVAGQAPHTLAALGLP
jgi:hypothetical protein